MWNNFIQNILILSKIDVESARRIADFTNSIYGLILENIEPDNKCQSYMLRKMLRILLDLCFDSKIEIEQILNLYINNSSVLDSNKIKQVVLNEKRQYLKIIQNRLKQLEREIKQKGSENIDIKYLK